MNNIDNNIDNQRQHNEILFWKVYQNKFIRNKIFNHIQNDKIEYQDISKYYIGNRFKFQFIRSLKWMIENKQFKLLNYKIKCGEFLIISQHSITFLFNFIKNEKNIQYQDQAQESLELLLLSPQKPTMTTTNKVTTLSSYKESLECVDLITLAINYCNLKFLKLYLSLPNQNFNGIVNKKTIMQTILNCSSIEVISFMVDYLKSKEEYQDLVTCVLVKSIKIVTSTVSDTTQTRNVDETIQFILDNGLYQSTTNNSIQEKIEITPFLTNIKSRELQIKLIGLNMLYRDNDNVSILFEKLIKSLNLPLEELKFYLLLINKSSLANNNTGVGSGIMDIESIDEKEIKKRIIKSANSIDRDILYFQYLVCYDEILEIENFQTDHLIYEYTFSLFSIVGLKYLMTKSVATQTNISPRWTSSNNYKYQDNLVLYKNDILNKNGGESRMIEFIQLYYKQREQYPVGKNTGGLEFSHWVNVGAFILKHCSTDVLQVISQMEGYPYMEGLVNVDFEVGEIKPFSKYQWYMENIIFESVSGREVDYHGFNNYLAPIQTKSDIDYIFATRNPSIKVNNTFFPVEYKNDVECIELATYFHDLFKHIPLEYIYKSPFVNSLLSFNQQVVSSVDQFNIQFDIKSIIDHPNKSMIIPLKSIETTKDVLEFQQFFKYLYDTNYISFKSLSWYQYQNIIFTRLVVSNELFENGIAGLLSTIHINFNSYKFESLILLKELVYLGKFDLVMIILSSLEDIKLSQLPSPLLPSFFESTTTPSNYIIFESDNTDFSISTFKSGNKFQGILEIITQLLSKISFDQSIINPLKPLFQHLYKLVIQCDDITFKDIKMVLELYDKHSIDVAQFGLFECFNFLGIKSNKLIGYILARPKVRKLLDYNGKDQYDCNVQYENPYNRYFDIAHYLPIDSFSLDYIINSSVSKLLGEISDKFSKFDGHVMEEVKHDEEDVYYFSDIGEMDLLKNSFKRLIESDQVEINFQTIPNLSIFRNTFHCDLKPFFNEFPIVTNEMLFKCAINTSSLDLIDWVYVNYDINQLTLPPSSTYSFNCDQLSEILNAIFKGNFLDVSSYLLDKFKHLFIINDIKEWFIHSFNLGYIDMFKLLLVHFKNDLTLEPSEFNSTIKSNQIIMINHYLNENIENNNLKNKDLLLKFI